MSCVFMLSLLFFIAIRTAVPKAQLSRYLCPSLDDEGVSLEMVRFCDQFPGQYQTMARGAERSWIKCRQVLRYHPWDCDKGVNWTADAVYTIGDGSFEEAALTVVRVAGMTEALAKACRAGQDEDCGCGGYSEKKQGEDRRETWKWEGCPQAFNYAANRVRRLVESELVGSRPKALMKRSNVIFALKTLRESMKKRCRCIGYLGSCSLQTCMMTPIDLDPFLEKFLTSAASVSKKLDPKEIAEQGTPSYLEFLSDSPDFCRKHPPWGRECAPAGEVSCAETCCGSPHYLATTKKHLCRPRIPRRIVDLCSKKGCIYFSDTTTVTIKPNCYVNETRFTCVGPKT